MRTEWDDPRDENLFIPGGPSTAPRGVAVPDAMFRAQAPRDLVPPRGSATATFDKSTGTLICDFKDRLIQEDFILKALKWARLEYGDKLTHLTLFVCRDAMHEPGYAMWLDAKGFERQSDNPERPAVFAWRKELPKPRKKKPEEQ